MRARKPAEYVPSVMRLEAILDLDSVDLYLTAPEQPEDTNEVIGVDLFEILKPGNERVCVVLRAEGFTYKSIAEIMGLSEGQIKNIIYTIRKRIVASDPFYAPLAQIDKNNR